MAGTSSLPASTVNLFKSIVGAGVLSLPSGLAAMSSDRSGVLPGLGLAGFLAAASAYSFWMLGRLCLDTNATTYAGLMVGIFGQSIYTLIETLIVCKTFSAALMYEMIMGNLARDLAALVGFSGPFASRGALLIGLAVLVLTPLSMMRSLAALAPFAAVGTIGVLYTAVFMGVRLAQGAYAPGGAFYVELDTEPFGGDGGGFAGIFVLLSMLSTAYIAHFNAPRFANQLFASSEERLAKLCGASFLLAFMVMGCVMSFGFLTFGGQCKGLILDNYAVEDPLAVWARLANLVSVLAGFPFVLVAFRDGVLQLLVKPRNAGSGWKASLTLRRAASTVLVALLTAVACMLTDLGFVVALMGALLATTLIYILPALAFLRLLGPKIREQKATRAERAEYVVNKALLVLGTILAFVGVGSTCYNEAKKLGFISSSPVMNISSSV